MSKWEEQLSLQINRSGLPVPEREYRFHPSRRWRFDFAWPDKKVACEVEGAVWVAGRHTRGSGFVKDAEKYAEAAIDGWTVIRVVPEMIKKGLAIYYLTRLLRGFEAQGRIPATAIMVSPRRRVA